MITIKQHVLNARRKADRRRWAVAGTTTAAAMALVTCGLSFAGTAGAPTTSPAAEAADAGVYAAPRDRFVVSSTPGVQSTADVTFAAGVALGAASTQPIAAAAADVGSTTQPVAMIGFDEPLALAAPLALVAATQPAALIATTQPVALMEMPSPTTMPTTSVRWEPTAARASVAPAAAPAVVAKPTVLRAGQLEHGKLALSTNRTAELRTVGPIKRVSVGQPEIADVQPFGSNILLVTAKKPGTTQLIVWDEHDKSESIDVSVEIPLEQLRDLITKVAPGARVDVSVAADQIVLRGQAPSLLVAKQIGDVAGAYGKVQNFIEVAGAQTVAVQVQFAEVSRTVTSSLGVAWAGTDGTALFGSDPTSSGLLGTNGTRGSLPTQVGALGSPGAFNIFGSGSIAGNPFAYFVKALRDNSLLRVLQEPTLTTTSGEPASFIAGGQVAIPVPADNGSIGIEYKEYGVRLLLTPIVLGNGKIKLIMEAESSDLDYANGTTIQGAAVPGLRTKRVQNIVEMGEGQTMSVAGLLDDSVIASKQSVPLLGDLPVLGQLFRSTRYQRKETELVVLITPRLAGAMNPGQVPPLPGGGWRHPSELEQFAFGDLGGNKEADATKDWNKNPADRGSNAPGKTGGLEQSGRIASRQGRDPNQPPPTFLGDHGFAPAPRREESTAVATVKE